ncbi:MAG: hypothetical protein KKF21_01550, partial [Bacteroidetes bacterium]|nr:hypothetical protein [Bacteroidota bacterium]
NLPLSSKKVIIPFSIALLKQNDKKNKGNSPYIPLLKRERDLFIIPQKHRMLFRATKTLRFFVYNFFQLRRSDIMVT